MTVSRTLLGVASVTAVVVAWQAAATFAVVNPLLLPAPTEIVETARDLAVSGYRQIPLWQHLAVSVARGTVAFVVAIVAGVPLGLVMGMSPTLDAVLDPFVQFLRPLPKIALIPLVIVWLGIGETSKFFLIFVSALLSIVVGSAAAVARVGRGRVRAAQTLGASRSQLFRHVILPGALPEVFTAIRLSIGIGWTSLIAAEMVAADSGLGWMVVNAGTYLRTDVVMLGIVLLGVTGWLFDRVIVVAQRRFVPWAGQDA